MVKLVMKDLPLMEAPDRAVSPAGNGDLIDVLATYENKGMRWAIPYIITRAICMPFPNCGCWRWTA